MTAMSFEAAEVGVGPTLDGLTDRCLTVRLLGQILPTQSSSNEAEQAANSVPMMAQAGYPCRVAQTRIELAFVGYEPTVLSL